MGEIDVNPDFCCTCLKVDSDQGEIFLRLSYAPMEDISYTNKLKTCIPEMRLGNTDDYLLCQPCSIALENAYNFRCMCLQNENKLEEFILSRNRKLEAVQKHIKKELIEQSPPEEMIIEPEELNLPPEELNLEPEELILEPEELNLKPEAKFQVNAQPSDDFSEDCSAQPEEYSMNICIETEGDIGGDSVNSVELEEAQNGACTSFLPEKSKKRYEVMYSSFKRWLDMRAVKCVTEEVVLAYFVERSKKLKSPAGLWSEYSMLKTTMLMYDNVDIAKYSKVPAFLKRKNKGYHPNKSKVFSKEDIDKFLTEAPDDVYLLMKVVMIMGVAGGCRREELCNITIDDIEDTESILIVKISDPDMNQQRTFTVINSEDKNIDFIDIYRKYVRLRPYTNSRRFFMQYNSGRCVNQPVGRNAIAKMPSRIAEYLNLENPEHYTGRSFRSTSATLLTNKGIDVLSKI